MTRNRALPSKSRTYVRMREDALDRVQRRERRDSPLPSPAQVCGTVVTLRQQFSGRVWFQYCPCRHNANLDWSRPRDIGTPAGTCHPALDGAGVRSRSIHDLRSTLPRPRSPRVSVFESATIMGTSVRTMSCTTGSSCRARAPRSAGDSTRTSTVWAKSRPRPPGQETHWERENPPFPAGFRGGRYWARTSDPQLVELVLSQLS
jgi:hypothetical protein